MPQLYQLRHDQFLQLLGFETQMFQAPVGCVALMDQLDAFLGVFQGVLPALEAGLDKRLDLCGTLLQQGFVGGQYVVVEIDPVLARIDQSVGHLLLLQPERFVGNITVERIGVAVDQILRVETGPLQLQLSRIYAFAGQGDAQFCAFRRRHQHYPLAGKILWRVDVRVGAHYPDDWRALHDRRQCHHRLALHARDDQAAVGNGKVGIAVEQGVYWFCGSRSARENLHIQPGPRIEAFFQGHVVAGELELVQPAQLQAHFLHGHGLAQAQQLQQQQAQA
ncbi:hypothetical protein D3C80_1227050 [compost metagenome]